MLENQRLHTWFTKRSGTASTVLLGKGNIPYPMSATGDNPRCPSDQRSWKSATEE
ncbi:hypothetical protein YSA_00811 [Pseudomonas putida ND6]|uniref:Uncharacterized protein n=1 Tax=Pseudomonas putida ND6 TaxID=231023 RepID=I3UNZ8_PSEPU|nr:hypothetical protein YSA_00811 [Pseudomonas putida ND6]